MTVIYIIVIAVALFFWLKKPSSDYYREHKDELWEQWMYDDYNDDK